MMLHLRHKKENDARLWWDSVDEYWDRFFEASATLNSMSSQHDLESLLVEMETAKDAVETARYPDDVIKARSQLLNAMQNIIVGFQQALSGNLDDADDHMGYAQSYLASFDRELNRLIA